MNVWRSLADVPIDVGPTVVTIGNFDGVHRGHRHVLDRAREVATGLEGARLVVVTFDPHPMAVLRPEHAPVMLSHIDQRAVLLSDSGADDILVLPFDRETAAWSPEEFCQRVLVDTLQAVAVVVGANFRFGHRAAGDVSSLREFGADHGFAAHPVELDGGPQVWSSSYIRQCLAAGDLAGAEEALGRPVTVSGPVVRGDQRGRDLGFPTANIDFGDLAVPTDGVYAGWLTRDDTGERFPAAVSIGTNPTFEGVRETRVEAYVLDRDDLELYGVPVTVEFVERLRGMRTFRGDDWRDQLITAMAADVERTRTILA